jgi:hypothetical protein
MSCLPSRQLLYLHGVGNRSPKRVGGGACALRSRRASWPTYQSEPEGGRARWRLVVRGGDLSSEAETSRARQRLVVRGGDYSCEAETCRGDPSCGELVEDATNWLKTGRLASVGLD